jgi:hypothetical protein
VLGNSPGTATGSPTRVRHSGSLGLMASIDTVFEAGLTAKMFCRRISTSDIRQCSSAYIANNSERGLASQTIWKLKFARSSVEHDTSSTARLRDPSGGQTSITFDWHCHHCVLCFIRDEVNGFSCGFVLAPMRVSRDRRSCLSESCQNSKEEREFRRACSHSLCSGDDGFLSQASGLDC